ncbi:hypothetical protein [Mesorhizobium sp. STM 4661]|uniref:hypothetical protein n=1 Tax=Mesorhizobium sp. STM 4661 TaxID=1297570 RepID=UPI0002BE3C25|nr:hypothetical protein [Mesorhizobium sp. STM 4661]CCV13487.1 hypothetical protein MESS4_560097 [Mesorhizobium sp. STM 4661]
MGAIAILASMPGRPRAGKRHDRHRRFPEFGDGYFLDQRVQCQADALARFVETAEAVLRALQKLARRSEVASHDNTYWFGRRTDIVSALN